MVSAFSSMAFKNSFDSSSRKRKHAESESPAREADEIRNDDDFRHNSISSYKSINPKYFKTGKYINHSKNERYSELENSIEKCISKLILKELEKKKCDKIKEKSEMKKDIRRLKDDCFELYGQLNIVKSKLNAFENAMKNNNNNSHQKTCNDLDELNNTKLDKMHINLKNDVISELTKVFEGKIVVAVEAALKEQNEKIESLRNSIDEISEKVDQLEKQLENGKLSVPNNTENAIAADMEEKLTEIQKEFSLKEPLISSFSEPKWLVPEQKCNELYKFCHGEVSKFLSEYLPLLYDLPEIIPPLKRDDKKEEAEKVITHFWNGSISMELITKESEKEHAAQRYKTTRKIYLGLKNFDGVIMSNKGVIYDCRWDSERRRYVPKSENADDSSSAMEWQLPKELQKAAYEKGKDYIIVAKNDDSNQTSICKIDLYDFEIDLLYTKRKYDNT